MTEEAVLDALKERFQEDDDPVLFQFVKKRFSPFQILISTLISLKTRDEVTLEASLRLFALADSPEAMREQSLQEMEKALYPAGFYRVKAGRIHEISRILSEQYDGKVPSTREALLALPGVGRKTANLTLGLAFGIPAICVDTHVHRIANHLGWVQTETPDETEAALEKIIPPHRRIELNRLLVRLGQTLFKPRSSLSREELLKIIFEKNPGSPGSEPGHRSDRGRSKPERRRGTT